MSYEPSKVLAQALKQAKNKSEDGVLESSALNPKQAALLKKAGCLTQVIRGWYLLSRPEPAGSSTVWYVGFWNFIKVYLLKRFGKHGYCLSADTSLDLHTGEGHIAKQVTAITRKPSNQTVALPHDTSLLLYADTKNFPRQLEKLNGIYVMPLPLALCRLSPAYYKNKPLNVEIALKMLQSVTEVSRILLDGALVTDAGRIAGAFRAIGESPKAEQIVRDMQAAGLSVSEINPFENHVPSLSAIPRIKSAYSGRIEAMWKRMRSEVISEFPDPPGTAPNKEERVIRIIQERYKHDAYHSLSIEGYEVTEDLLQRIAEGNWRPDVDPKDHEQIDAMAAKGYHEAFQQVLKSVRKTIVGLNAGKVFEDDLQNWYRALFSPSVQAGILKAADLAGYRSGPVYIKGARHVPPGGKDAVLDSMETLFRLIRDEPHPAVRAVLGHFIFVYIHPYMDGNGRIGRLLLNLMLVSGGYRWTIIRIEERARYMAALEAASIEGRIEPFAKFVRSELDYWTEKIASSTAASASDGCP
ncbi:MAG: Fic family protein [Bdellovibrionaceae bacterium]|nr:Fic family protein [Pseudobdellovibrionaceae bacterium]